MKKKGKKNWLLNIALLVCVFAFLGSGLYLIRYYKNAKNSEDAIGELLELKEDGEDNSVSGDAIRTNKGRTVQKRYRKLFKKNKDMIGWITIKGTKIDYPVMQTPEDNEYYLHRNFDKESDVNGLPFLDAQCDVEENESNLMIYGHHMKSGLMFKHLMDFESESFYKSHKTVYLDTLFDGREYEVVSAFRSQIYKRDTDAFKYYEYIGPLTEKRFNTYVKNIKKQSLYETGITPKYGEQLLTLVTCAYHTEEGRFVVVARRKE